MAAQSEGGLPSHASLNPLAASRTALYVQPYRPYRAGWERAVSLEYGNAIESEWSPAGRRYLMDGELMRFRVGLSRDVGPNRFVGVEVGAVGSYAGFADDFFAWYHNLIGYHQPERLARPKNVFGDTVELGGADLVREPSTLDLDDIRLVAGIRYNDALQSVVSVTLPTATGGAGFGRGTVGLATVHTLRLHPLRPLVYEATIGVGATPHHGPLAPWQRSVFVSASAGIRLRVWGGQSVYGYFYYHSPYYHDTGFPSLDRAEVTGDFGWISRGRDGREWRFGLGEDLQPGDPGIDLILKIGRTW